MRKEIEIDSWYRKDAFNRFKEYHYPYLTICSQINVHKLVYIAKKRNKSFYSLMSWLVLKAVNEIDNFKTRFSNEDIYIYDKISLSFSELRENNSFGYSGFVELDNINRFSHEFMIMQKKIRDNLNISHRKGDDVIYVTCVPFLRTYSVINPMKLFDDDCIPRICWGKYEEIGEQKIIDISVQVHHSLADGADIIRFFKIMSELLEDI